MIWVQSPVATNPVLQDDMARLLDYHLCYVLDHVRKDIIVRPRLLFHRCLPPPNPTCYPHWSADTLYNSSHLPFLFIFFSSSFPPPPILHSSTSYPPPPTLHSLLSIHPSSNNHAVALHSTVPVAPAPPHQ